MRGLILGAVESKKVEEEEVRSEDRGYRLKRFDVQPFLGFRKVHVVIQSHCPLYAFEYGEKQNGPLGFMLADWANTLIAHWYTQPISTNKKEVYLEFQSDGCKGFGSKTLWAYSEPGRERLWFHVQAGFAVKKVREEWEGRIPNCPIILTSDVDKLVDGITTTRLSAEIVRYSQEDSPLVRQLRLKEGTVVHEYETRVVGK